MSGISTKVLMVAGLAVLLWVVPSVGTQGHGSRGEIVTHVDRAIVGQGASAADTLRAADEIVTKAVIGA